MSGWKQFFLSKGMLAAAIWYTLGTILTRAAEYVTLPIFTELLPPEDFGLISIYSMWVSVIMLFVGLQGNGSITNARMEFGEEHLPGYLSSISAMGFVSFSILLGLAFLFRAPVAAFFDLPESLVALMVIQSYGMFCVQMLTSTFTSLQKRYEVIILSAIVCFSTVGLSLSLVYRAEPAERYLARIYGIAIPNIILGALIVLWFFYKGKTLFNKKYWMYCLPLTVPLIFHMMSHIILGQSDRYMLSKMSGYAEAGLYSFAYTVGSLMTVVSSSFNLSWSPWYYNQYKDKKVSDIVHTGKTYRAIIMLVAIVLLFLMPELVGLMGAPEYQSAVYVVPLIQLGCFFNYLYLFPVTHEFYYKKTVWIASGTILSAIVNILLNLVFIPWLGSVGAAITTFISCFLLFVLHDFIVRKKLKDFPISHRDLYACAGILSVLTAVYYPIRTLLWARLGMILLAAVLFSWYFVRHSKKRLFLDSGAEVIVK